MTARTPGRLIAALVLVGFAAAITWGVEFAPLRVEPPPPPYPELDRADAKVVAAMDAAWGPVGKFDRIPDRDDSDGPYGRILPVLDRDPAKAPAAMVAFLHRRLSTPDGCTVTAAPSEDEKHEWVGCWFRDHADPATRSLLLRMVADPAIDEDLRQQYVVAICRRGDDAAREVLERIVLDAHQGSSFRNYVLQRMPRLGGRAPERLHDLLYLPFCNLSTTAAAALSEWGDPEAPSVLVEGLGRAVERKDDSSRAMCANALLPMLGDDPDLGPRLADAANEVRSYTWTGGKDRQKELELGERQGFRAAASDVRTWIDAHPERRDTEFERGRREYLASDRRRRELATSSFDVVLQAKDGDDFDLAAALLIGTEKSCNARDDLELLDRLARLIRRDAGPSPTPAAWIEALNRRLLDLPNVHQVGTDPSDLRDVLATGYGNCLGRSSLYLAVAERLGLPIRAVAAPAHVFVRWDDGVVRRNIEATDRGAEHDDRWYATCPGGLAIRDEDIRSGAFLRNLTKREFLGLALVNRSGSVAESGDVALALEWADLAVRLAPDAANARTCRAHLTLEVRPADRDAAVADLRAAEARRRLNPREASSASSAYLASGLAADALRVAEAGLLLDASDIDLALDRGLALVRLCRLDEARRVFQDAVKRAPERLDILRGDIVIRIAEDDPAWRDRLARVVADPIAEPRVHLDVAEDLLGGIAGRPPSPQDAARVLDQISELEQETDDSRRSRKGGTLRNNAIVRQQRRYYDLRIRCCRALGDEAGAAKFEEARQALSSR